MLNSMATKIKLGISTCPNDTFAFHGLLERLVDWRGLEFQIELLDIQELNRGLRLGQFDVAKGSYFAALKLANKIVVLPSGSALGFGVGPLLLAAQPDSWPTSSHQVVLCPGEDTTASLLFQLFYPRTVRSQQTLFSDIMPALQRGEADFGVCIHEGRFTWQTSGLHLVEDLGTRWETETNCPLPLGGIFANKSLGDERLGRVHAAIEDSVRLARQNPQLALPTMRRYAQEMDDQVLMQHVQLYVNDWTVDLGPVGCKAVDELARRAMEVGQLDSAVVPLSIWQAR
ncbi:MAG: 1,4-dihydroxy-6-naphthoate synthase [Pirellulaceae bacterium]|nr:1,4-dihydroxy-6-naphthoate synthase [Pirellulaceae bacterium]